MSKFVDKYQWSKNKRTYYAAKFDYILDNSLI